MVLGKMPIVLGVRECIGKKEINSFESKFYIE
jgi:hypothetical protein